MEKSEKTPDSTSNSQLTHEQRIDHARYCLENAQGIARFTDGKTAVLSSLALTLIGGVVYLVKLVLGVESSGLDWIHCGWLRYVLLTTAGLSLASGFLTLIFCISTNIARNKTTSGHVALFPIHGSKSQNEMDAKREEISETLKQLSTNQALLEYADQLSNLGSIINRKVNAFNKASYTFCAQLWFAAGSGILFVISSFS